ncbi:MAG: hypothetical protein ACOCXJ_01680 [Planctomycetota bacterium]
MDIDYVNMVIDFIDFWAGSRSPTHAMANGARTWDALPLWGDPEGVVAETEQQTARMHRRISQLPLAAIILLLAAIAPGGLSAVEAIDPEQLPEGWDDWRFIPYAEMRYSAEEAAGSSGDLAISQGRLGLRVEKIPALWLHLGFNAEFGALDYSGDLVDRSTIQGSVGITPTLRFHESWSVFAPLALDAGWEEDGPQDGNHTVQYGLGIQYHRSLSRRIGMGLVLQTRLEDDDTLLPFITADWRFNDRWRLVILDPIDGISRLRYAITERWTCGLRASTELAQFRLADDTVLEDDHIAIALAAGYRGDSGPSLGAFLGLVAWREITLRDDRGAVINQETVDPALHAGLEGRWHF